MTIKQIFLLTLLSLTCVPQAQAMDRRKPGPYDLYGAIKRGDDHAVADLLARGADLTIIITDQNGHCETALETAIACGDRKIISLIVNFTNRDGESLLCWAIFNDKLEMAKVLLTHGADTNIKTFDGEFLLYWTLVHNKLEMTRMLLAHGADASTIDNHDNTSCFHLALKRGKPQLVDIFLRNAPTSNITEDYISNSLRRIHDNDALRQQMTNLGLDGNDNIRQLISDN